jgi:hypothetical protein
MEDGKQAAKIPVSSSLVYEEALAIENKYTGTVTDETVTLPMATAKFLLVRCSGENVSVKLNGGGAITVTKGTGFIMLWSSDGAITALSVTVASVPATLKVLTFA